MALNRVFVKKMVKSLMRTQKLKYMEIVKQNLSNK